MATVPVVPGPSVAPQGVTVYQNDRGATGAAFGLPQAEATIEAGNKLAQTSNRFAEIATERQKAVKAIQDRENAVKRVEITDALSEQWDVDFVAQSQKDAFATMGGVAEYRKRLSDDLLKAVNDHDGDTASKLQLRQMLDQAASKLHARAVDAGVKASTARVNDLFGRYVGEQADLVGQDPSHINDAIANVNQRIQDAVHGIVAPEQEIAMKRAAYGQIASAATTYHIETGNYKEARAVLGSLAGLIPNDEATSLRTKIIVGETTANKDNAKRAGVRNRMVAAGWDPSDPKLQAAIEGLPGYLLEGPKTLSGRVEEFERIGKAKFGPDFRINDDQFAKIADAYVAERPAGNSPGLTNGRALELLARDAPEFAAGTLDDFSDRMFLSAVAAVTQPSQISGVRGELPGYVRNALKKRGINPDAPLEFTSPEAGNEFLQPKAGTAASTPTQGAAAPATGGTGQQAAAPAQPTEPQVQAGVAALNSLVEQTRSLEDKGGLFAPDAPRLAIPMTIFQAAGYFAGPVPAAQATINALPLVGETFLRSPQVTEMRKFLDVFSNDLVRSLQNSPKFAETERAMLDRINGLKSSFFDNPTNFRANLMGLDQALASRIQHAEDIKKTGGVSRDEIQHQADAARTMEYAREVLGVEYPVKTPQEASKLPPNTIYVVTNKDGSTAKYKTFPTVK